MAPATATARAWHCSPYSPPMSASKAARRRASLWPVGARAFPCLFESRKMLYLFVLSRFRTELPSASVVATLHSVPGTALVRRHQRLVQYPPGPGFGGEERPRFLQPAP